MSCWYLDSVPECPLLCFFFLAESVGFAVRIGDLDLAAVKTEGRVNLGLCWGRGAVNIPRICGVCCMKKEPLVTLAWSQPAPVCAVALGIQKFSSQAAQLPLPGTQQLPSVVHEVVPADLIHHARPPSCQSTPKHTGWIPQGPWAMPALLQLHLCAS